ncbi:MAG: nuclear transport factor 2 family protein [Solirubrobacterales bacterium]
MSEETTTSDLVELTVRCLESGSRGYLDVGMSFFAPDCIWEVPALATRFEGLSAIRGFLEDWLGAFEGFEIQLDEVLDLGNGVVLALARENARPVGSSGHAGLQEVFAYVVVWVEGMIARVTVSGDVDEARAAAHRLAESSG